MPMQGKVKSIGSLGVGKCARLGKSTAQLNHYLHFVRLLFRVLAVNICR